MREGRHTEGQGRNIQEGMGQTYGREEEAHGRVGVHMREGRGRHAGGKDIHDGRGETCGRVGETYAGG